MRPKYLIPLTLIVAVLAPPAFAASCPKGSLMEVTKTRKSSAVDLSGKIVTRLSSSKICFEGQTYKKRDYVTKAYDNSVKQVDCSSKSASASGARGGAVMGSGSGC